MLSYRDPFFPEIATRRRSPSIGSLCDRITQERHTCPGGDLPFVDYRPSYPNGFAMMSGVLHDIIDTDMRGEAF